MGGETMPVLAWLGPPAGETTVARYEELAAAGFTHNFSGFPSLEALQHGLDIAESTGIKLMASCPELRQSPGATARAIKDHPALGGYYLRDEPGAEQFGELAAWVRAIQAVDAEHMCYINLFPTYASSEQLGTATYEAYVNAFLDTVPVTVLSFDHYPIRERNGDVTLNEDYYRNLRIIAEAARKRDMPFWAFALSVAHDPYPTPTATHLRLQVNSNLIYGAQAIQYFTYWTPQSNRWDFHDAPIGVDGIRTATYDVVQRANAALAPWLRAFRGGTVIRTGHIGEPLPEDTATYTFRAPFISADTEGRHAVFSRLQKGFGEYLAVLNPSLHDPLRVQLEVEGAVIRVMPGEGAETVHEGTWSSTLAPGEIALLTW